MYLLLLNKSMHSQEDVFHALEYVFHHLEYDLAPSYDLKDDNYHQNGGSYDHFSDKYD